MCSHIIIIIIPTTGQAFPVTLYWVGSLYLYNQYLLIPSFDHVSCFLSNGVQGRSQVPADLEWYNRGIDDADIAGTVNREIGVNHTSKFVRHHGSCSYVVEVGAICNVVSD
jgi:hypothetical protein